MARDAGSRPTGRLWRADDWLRTRLPHADPPDLADLSGRLARLGITAVTDATPDLAPTALAAFREAVTGGALRQRLHLLGVPLGSAFPRDLPRLTVGPYKIVLADSGCRAFRSWRTGSARPTPRAEQWPCTA